MALLNPTFVIGLVVLFYLSTFVVFAVLRIVTGLSIQRVGYFSLRRLAYTPRDGFKIEIRGLGLNVHRPTFAQPTWLSIVVSELVVTIDIQELEGAKAVDAAAEEDEDELPQNRRQPGASDPPTNARAQSPKPGLLRRAPTGPPRSELWKHLMKLKDRIKRLHRNVNWLRLVDVVASNSSVNVVDVGNVQFGSLTVAVDTRRKMVDRARFFLQPRSRTRQEQNQAEWIMTLRSVLFTPQGRESTEILDHATLNIHGFLYENLDGLRDAALALKLGRVHLPYDDLQLSAGLFKECRSRAKKAAGEPEFEVSSVDDVVQEIQVPGSTDQELMQTVSDSKEFISSLLRGIKEVQFAVSFVGLTKKVEAVKAAPVLVNLSMKEVGIDLHRLDPKSPAHRMYFPSKDIAHEALVAALSMSVGVDDGQGKPQRILYVPMATTTVRTTLPSKTVELTAGESAEQRNANILFANSVVTSPSVDLDPRHLPLLLAMLQRRPSAQKSQRQQRHILISRLLPKANIKFTMHEPVLRIALPPVQKSADPDDFDLIISSISSISLDLESFHSTMENLDYSLASSMRVQTHHLYYQTSAGSRFDILQTESFDLKIQLGASPDVHVVATGNLQTFSVKMVRPEITNGLRHIVRQLRLNANPERKPKASKHQNFLRAMPAWLLHFHIQFSDFSVEIAGIDEKISEHSRGVALQLESWVTEYRAQRLDGLQRRMPRRRASSRTSMTPEADLLKTIPLSPRKKHQNPGDGRRMSVQVRGLEAFIVQESERWEVEPFVNIPRFEIACSTLSDHTGPVFHIHCHVRTLLVQYSLYRHYSVGVAVMVLRRAFLRSNRETAATTGTKEEPGTANITPTGFLSPPKSPGQIMDGQNSTVTTARELIAIDVKAALVQVKADMPADPPIMLQIHGLEAGRHRYSPPFFHSKLIRLYAQAPRMRGVWARVVSIKNGRLDYRESRKAVGKDKYREDKMFDAVADAIRFAVPHELIFNKVSDNFINVFKSVQQLHHRFRTGTDEYVLKKGPEGPKSIPKVSIRSRTFLFELEDGAFEWKLGMIYRAGRIEQIQRLAREEAFQVKVKKIHEEEAKRESNKFRARSVMSRGRSKHGRTSWAGTPSEEGRPRSSSESPGRGRPLRYDPDSAGGMSGRAHVSIQEARQRLNEHNGQSWRKRIDRQFTVARENMQQFRSLFWGADHMPDDVDDFEHILEVPQRPGLMATLIHDLRIVVDKPSFPISELQEFLHKIGKGMPRDMQYSLLVPMNVSVDMGEVKSTLRDYPLPLLHVPGIKVGQPSRFAALSLKSDFVIAEEYHGSESIRRIPVTIIPPKDASSDQGAFVIEVRRTVGPVKSYSDINVDINTSLPTKITWAPSYQPAIQDMMMAIESFTKPQLDPSERVGFWDKIRLNLHSRIRVAWTADGDVHFALKGTRDPYQVTGAGAGFLMCWRNDVRWNVNVDGDPKRFMTVDAGEYVMAVPDFGHYVRAAGGDPGALSNDDGKPGATFQKVIMKLSGRVQWMAGLVFERAIEKGKRSFDFKPHYEVVLKTPQNAVSLDDKPYDAFRGFRSQHIHLSVAVCAPADREWTTSNPEPSRSYNTVHLTPRFFTHFFAWWSLFGGPMSLPIRQGPLWPGREKNSKKFGRHLGTIKYNLLLAPLFMSHIYKHKDAEDHSEGAMQATGIKVRFDSFMLDLHQRREEFNTRDRGNKAQQQQSKTTGMKIHAGQLDLSSVDVRAVSASMRAGKSDHHPVNHNSLPGLDNGDDEHDLSRFTIPDKDFSWIDMDDFVELDTLVRSQTMPETKILPLAYAPRVTYFRQTDIGGVIAGDASRSSPFGDEPTHFCIMSQDDDPRRVQTQLIRKRLAQLKDQIEAHIRNLGDVELKMIKADHKDDKLRVDFEELTGHSAVLHEKRRFLENMLQQMRQQNQDSEANLLDRVSDDRSISIPLSEGSISLPSGAEFASDFKNRFVVHNMQLKWNNLLRNIILRYIHQVSQRRGFVYYLSRPAIKFILDIVEEQAKSKTSKPTGPSTPAPSGTTTSSDPTGFEKDAANEIEDRIRRILQEGKKFVNADDTKASDTEDGEGPGGGGGVSMGDLAGGIADGFTPQHSYHVRLIAPQIQLQSDSHPKNVVLIAAKGMELKVVEVLDKDRIYDMVSGLVQRRFLVNMDSTQFFVTQQKWFSTHAQSMHSGSTYGTPIGSSWPPWVPMEVMFDFRTKPFGFSRVVQKTSAMLRYDKYNTLRLKYNDEVNTGPGGGGGGGGSEGSSTTSSQDGLAENRMDNLWVEFPQARAVLNSSQYYAMYMIVQDLLMYSEPAEKHRSERLEKIMLASDFSDLRGAPEMVVRLQERICQLQDIRTHFQVHAERLDRRGWEDARALERDLAACEDELFFTMKAITTSQSKHGATDQGNALLKWNISAREVVWQLLRDNGQPLVELQLKETEYDRTDNADGSHINLVRVGRVVGLNLLPDAIYPEMIAPYVDERSPAAVDLGSQPMIQVYWNMLEAIAGIPVMDHFEVNLFPLKVQLESKVGRKLLEYIFPNLKKDRVASGSGGGGGSGSGSGSTAKADSPFILKAENDDGEDASNTMSGSTGRLADNKDAGGQFNTRAGSLELRLRPTLNSDVKTPAPKSSKALSVHSGETGHTFRLFRSSATGATSRTPSKKPSAESLRSGTTAPRPGIGRTSTGFSTMNQSINGDSKKSSRFGLRTRQGGNEDRADKASDDLTKMIARASNYMTFAYIKMPSVVLCLSYKGKGDRNLEDVHDFVFRLPTIEYRNKTWSNLDLAMALKSRVIKALISHTGAIIGNKFSRHRPSTAQQTKLRELASGSALLATPSPPLPLVDSRDNSDDSSSLFGGVDYSRSPPRSSIRSDKSSVPGGGGAQGGGAGSRSSSVTSARSQRSNTLAVSSAAVPTYLMMTPPTPSTTFPIALNNGSGGSGLSADDATTTRRPASSGSLGGGRTRGGSSGDSSDKTERRRTGLSGMRVKLSALTSKLKDRESTSTTTAAQEGPAREGMEN